MIYFNENEPYVAAWLRNLYPSATVDDRSIVDVKGSDLTSYQRVHLFGGIGGWEYALHLAGWPEDQPVWTGSCPCQPFSNAGRRRGVSDERHLWPEMLRLVSECHPPTIFGEQVVSPAGREWLAGVFADLENLGYAVAGADLCAAGVGAPHIRQRVWWMGHAIEPRTTDSKRREAVGPPQGVQGEARQRERLWLNPWQPSDTIPCADGLRRRIEPSLEPLANGIPARVGRLRAYGNSIVPQVAARFIRAFMEATLTAPNAHESDPNPSTHNNIGYSR